MNVKEVWQQIAVDIGHKVRSMVNTPDTIGGDDETGYVLMFFNAKHHDGKSTIVSSAASPAELKQLLRYALSQIDQGAVIVEPPSGPH